MASEQRQASHEDPTQAFEQAVLAIAKAVAVRDMYTGDHQTHVTELSAAIAKEMGMSEFRIQGLRLAAAIHDLGNLNIPSDILNKPGKLSDIEFEMIKTHPEVGSEIIKEIDFPWPISEIILQHHEQMDGSGYPRGLKGEEILLESRVLMVANVIEAMMAYRPCQDSLPVDAVIAELRQYRGVKYDASVVDAGIKVLQAKPAVL